MKNYKVFKNKYILIEDIKGTHQPFHKEYTKPPQLSLNSKPLGCPFQENKKFKPSSKKRGPKSGFCEVCYNKFTDYDLHVREYEHREFARDSNNYKKIDHFISTTKFSSDEECEISSSPLGRFTSSAQVCDFEPVYDRILHLSRISTDNSENLNDVVNIKEWLKSLE